MTHVAVGIWMTHVDAYAQVRAFEYAGRVMAAVPSAFQNSIRLGVQRRTVHTQIRLFSGGQDCRAVGPANLILLCH